MLADDVVRSDFKPHRLAPVAAVLRVATDDAKRVNDGTRADRRVLLEHHMAEHAHAFTQDHARAHDRPRPDLDPVSQFGAGVDLRCRMDGHQATG